MDRIVHKILDRKTQLEMVIRLSFADKVNTFVAHLEHFDLVVHLN
jgi:hypothetical protein